MSEPNPRSSEITILLSVVTFSLLISDIMPPSSTAIPIITIYFLCVMCMSTVSVTASVLVISLHFRNAKTYTMPVWVSRIFHSEDQVDDPLARFMPILPCRFKSTFVIIWLGCCAWRVRAMIWLGARFVVNGHPRWRHTTVAICQLRRRLRIMWTLRTNKRFYSQWIFPSTAPTRKRLEPAVHCPSVHPLRLIRIHRVVATAL